MGPALPSAASKSSITRARGLIAGPGRGWLGLDYICYEIDSLWTLPDAEMARLAIGEASGIGLFESG
jgi:hypothetical protein